MIYFSDQFARSIYGVLFAIIMIVCLSSRAQEINLKWAKSYGNSGAEHVWDFALDDTGNVIITGRFEHTVDFDPDSGVHNLTSVGNDDIFVQKLSPNGDLKWAFSIGGLFDDDTYAVDIDHNGDIIVIGDFFQTVDFDPRPTVSFNLTASGQDYFIAKYSANSDLKWVKTFSANISSEPKWMTTDEQGSIYVSGFYYDSLDLDPGINEYFIHSQGDRDCFMQKLDSSGNFIWGKSIGGPGKDIGYSHTIDKSGNVIFTGVFEDTVDFDPDSLFTYFMPSKGQEDIFILMLDSVGDFQWAKSVGGATVERPYNVVTDENGSVIISGVFTGSIDFDPGIGLTNVVAQGIQDAFTLKLSAIGAYEWVYCSQGTRSAAISSSSDSDGNIYVVGGYWGTVDFDFGSNSDNRTASALQDFYVQKLDSTGSYLWTETFGGVALDVGTRILCDENRNIFIAGYYASLIDFDPDTGTYNLATNGGFDNFISRYDQCKIDSSVDVRFECDSLRWIDDKLYLESNSTAIDTIKGLFFCDSIIRLDLTIGSETYVDTVLACEKYTWTNGQTYTTSQNVRIINTNKLGCDSTNFLTLTVQSIDETVIISDSGFLASTDSASYQWLDCANNLSPLTGDTNRFFRPKKSGQYAVAIILDGCRDTSDCLFYNGMDERFYSEPRIRLIPNPTSGTFRIQGLEKESNVSIFSIEGNLIERYRGVSSNQEFRLDENLNSGLYFIRIESQKSIKTLRLVYSR